MILRRFVLLTRFIAASVGLSPTVRAGLLDYVKRPDLSYAWSVEGRNQSPAGTVHQLKLTSQTWQGIPWEHRLEIYEPARLVYPETVLLFIGGGHSGDRTRLEDAAIGLGLARVCGARCAMLYQVPNQPLLGGKSEDDLIAETFVRYLDTKDPDWPLLFPMVKSAVRAMDAVQDWARRETLPPVERFVVSGASKRGWTTWLTGAVDDRVKGIAPMVIVMLNFRAQNPHQLEVWGRYSEQIDDYVRRGLMGRLETPDGLELWRMIDPYTYRDRLALPKLLIDGTNDRYWTLDALNLFWDELPGPKYVVNVPNAGHGLDRNRDYATNAIGAFFRSVASDRPLPKLSWNHDDGPDHALRLVVRSVPAPGAARLWVARSATLDFRDASWEAAPMTIDGQVASGSVERPDDGFIALFGDLDFELDGQPFHLSTQIRQAGAAEASP